MGDTLIQRQDPPLTFEAVWAMFQETDRLIQESKKEFDQQLRESKKEFDQQLQESRKEFDRQLRESKKDLDRRMGDLGNRFGELAEHLVAPSIHEKFNALGYHFDIVATRGCEIKLPEEGLYAEIDILLENADYVIAVEVKSKPSEKDIDAHIRRIEIMRCAYDQLHNARKIRGAMAGAIFPHEVKQYALKKGFYVIEQTGDTVRIDVPEGFAPREW
ncbi:MAG: hypothetical protein LBQ55_02115 [Treponema sp.]|jgi:hypothetical protein|nr:hypothetical protein [Treponema sp.]